MKKHTRIYLTAMGYDESDWICCEVYGCEAKAVDIHHIEARGMGGTKRTETIEDVMALCRHHHEKFGDITEFKGFLKCCHETRMKERNVNYKPELL